MLFKDIPVGTYLRLRWRLPLSPEVRAHNASDGFIVRTVEVPTVHRVETDVNDLDPYDDWSLAETRRGYRIEETQWVRVEYVSGESYYETWQDRKVVRDVTADELKYLWIEGEVEVDDPDDIEYGNNEWGLCRSGIRLSNKVPPEAYEAGYTVPDDYVNPGWDVQVGHRVCKEGRVLEYSASSCTLELVAGIRSVPEAAEVVRPASRLDLLFGI
jgi:hypothetical protein